MNPFCVCARCEVAPGNGTPRDEMIEEGDIYYYAKYCTMWAAPFSVIR